MGVGVEGGGEGGGVVVGGGWKGGEGGPAGGGGGLDVGGEGVGEDVWLEEGVLGDDLRWGG